MSDTQAPGPAQSLITATLLVYGLFGLAAVIAILSHGFPPFAPLVFQQVPLLRLAIERRRMHSKQSHLRPLSPILAEQCACLFEYFCIELRR